MFVISRICVSSWAGKDLNLQWGVAPPGLQPGAIAVRPPTRVCRPRSGGRVSSSSLGTPHRCTPPGVLLLTLIVEPAPPRGARPASAYFRGPAVDGWSRRPARVPEPGPRSRASPESEKAAGCVTRRPCWFNRFPGGFLTAWCGSFAEISLGSGLVDAIAQGRHRRGRPERTRLPAANEPLLRTHAL